MKIRNDQIIFSSTINPPAVDVARLELPFPHEGSNPLEQSIVAKNEALRDDDPEFVSIRPHSFEA